MKKNLIFIIMFLTVTFFTQTSLAARSQLTIKEVRFIGLSAVSSRDVESALPFSIGETVRDELSHLASQALADYLNSRGFLTATVSVSVKDGIVNVKINEGPPCIVTRFWIDDLPTYTSKSVMLRMKSKMHSLVKIKEGDRFDEILIREKMRELREWLVNEHFILANTEKLDLKFNSSRTGVDVVAKIEYGERITFGFQGNDVFSKGELSQFINEQRTTGLGKDYLGVIERRIQDEYKSKGYNNVKIETKIAERPFGKHITFDIQEFERSELLGVEWDGLTEQNVAQANSIFFKNVSRLVQRGYLVEKDIEKAALTVIEDLRSRGYLFSKVTSRVVTPVKGKFNKVRYKVNIQIYEGDQTLVGKIEIKGNQHFQTSTILDVLSLKEDAPFNPFALEEGMSKLKTLYLDSGYLDVAIINSDSDIAQFTDNNRVVNIKIELVEGTKVLIDSYEIKGLEKTKKYIVERELEIKSGAPWTKEVVSKADDALRRLGLFSEIKIKPIPSSKGDPYRIMSIELKESDPGIVEAGPGFRSDLGLRLFSRVSYNNLLGRNWIGTLSAEGNRRVNSDYRFVEYKFDANFVDPRFFGTKNLFTLGLNTKKQRFPPDFNAVSTQFYTGLERRLSSIVIGRINYRLERIRQFDVLVNGQKFAIDNRSILIGSVGPSITVDTRDHPFLTTKGVLSSLTLEYAHPMLSGQDTKNVLAPSYQKWNGSVHYYTTIASDIVWSNVVAGGFIRSNDEGHDVPLIKLFRLGGFNTIRGFREDSLNVDQKLIYGTLTYVNLRSQIDFPLVGDLKIAPFIDAGNLYINNVFRDSPFLRAGTGIGLHYITPVGPINLDYGRKLYRLTGESEGQIHFSVGLI